MNYAHPAIIGPAVLDRPEMLSQSLTSLANCVRGTAPAVSDDKLPPSCERCGRKDVPLNNIGICRHCRKRPPEVTPEEMERTKLQIRRGWSRARRAGVEVPEESQGEEGTV